MKAKSHFSRRGHSRLGRRYDWWPDLPDQRDFLFQSIPVPETLARPSAVDLSSQCSPVFDQGKIGSCTGNALAGALEFLEIAELKASSQPQSSDRGQVYSPHKFEHVSRLFIYYNERALENRVDQDAGASLRDGIKALASWGACEESLWKYSVANVLKKPSAKAFTQAKDHKISAYLRLQSTEDMRACLASGYPFVFGFSVYESFESGVVAKTGQVSMPQSSERLLGGHAVLAVGYDDAQKKFLVRNSWGMKWGLKGYFWMPYEYLSSPGLAMDFWTLRS